MMHPREALKVVEAIEAVASSYDSDEDHIQRSIRYAFEELGRNMAEALEVPRCTCRYGHEESTPWANKDCPRRGFGS